MEIKTDIPGVYREDSGALINRDNSSLLNYKSKKELNRKISSLEKKIDYLLDENHSIKKVLEQLTSEDK
jgi:hypothetical protein